MVVDIRLAVCAAAPSGSEIGAVTQPLSRAGLAPDTHQERRPNKQEEVADKVQHRRVSRCPNAGRCRERRRL